ncbi:hypothetical protein Micbo1qcDRAFT_163059 [Microdochium bolleyi]|uniref:Uncharacterized protein n=1 Tax=Microdochium bolleyi TaxID=196109 RepID=A0A136J2H9_9PEZI|nr:hypothetical protein Micbo1qcDRAFT_163059 [Microdochium bolleyi]
MPSTPSAMAEWKQKEAALDADPTEALPPYSVVDDSHSVAVADSSAASSSGRQDSSGVTSFPAPPPFTAPPASSSPAPSGSIIESKASLAAAERARGEPSATGPTADAPFNFPSDATLPPYSPADAGAGPDATPTSAAPRHLPVLIPQVRPRADSPFLAAYSQDLLRYGIPRDTWLSFVDTLSAFLTANVSEKAISHAADIGRQLGDVPTDLGRSVADSAKHFGRDIKRSAMKGNIFGMATNIVGGAIGLTVGLPLKLAASATSLPARAAMAVLTPPQTPRERATAYALVANGEWFGQRGLKAQILDSQQVAELLGISMDDLLLDTKAARKAAEKRAAKQRNVSIIDSKRGDSVLTTKEPLAHLQGSIADLEEAPDDGAALSSTISEGSSKPKSSAAKNTSKHLEELGQGTIWLVVTQEKHKAVQGSASTQDNDSSNFTDPDDNNPSSADSRRSRRGRGDSDKNRHRSSISKD